MSISDIANYSGAAMIFVFLFSATTALQGRSFFRREAPPKTPVLASVGLNIAVMIPCATVFLIVFGLDSVSLAGGSARDAKYFIDSLPGIYGMEIVLMTIIGAGVCLNAGPYRGDRS